MKLVPLALLLLAGACSSSDDADPGAAFVGTWSTTTGSQTVSGCIFAKKSENLALTYTVSKGDGADVKLASSADPDCVLKANVVDGRATVVAGQTCTRTEENFKDTYTFATTSAMDLNGEGGAPAVKLEATFKRATLDGTDTGYECGFTEESPLKKN